MTTDVFHGINWKIENNVLSAKGFSAPISKIDSIKLIKPWWCILLGIILLLLGVFFSMMGVSEFNKTEDIGDKTSIIVLGFLSVWFISSSIMFFGSVKLLIFSGRMKYKVSAIFSSSLLIGDRKEDVLLLKKLIEERLGQ